MRRHLIVGRYGPDDKLPVPAAVDEVVTPLELASGNKYLDHGIGRALKDLAKLGVFPSEIGIDFLVVGAHVHAADTRISRQSESQDSWTREIRLVIPVSDVARWSHASAVLERMLNFLTGDRWTVGFRARPERFESAGKQRPANVKVPSYTDLTLFSGGLDSLIGVINLLESGARPLLISHAGEGATSNAQRKLYDALQKRYKNATVDRLRIWMNFRNRLVSGTRSENTTRGRSFLFLAGGIFAGTGLSRDFTLRVPENGLIALNVPLDVLRLGSLSTRTTHPFYLARWNELVRELGIPGRVENPYWDKTKGEMVAQCLESALLKNLLPDSLSCSSPAKARWKRRGNEHCGFCVPCLIRRAAILHGLGADPTTYTVSDLGAQVLDTRKAIGEQVRSFQVAISRLHERPSLAALLIHKPGPLSDNSPEEKQALGEVYRRGLAEVGVILADVRTGPS